jgi:hypothetical protein
MTVATHETHNKFQQNEFANRLAIAYSKADADLAHVERTKSGLSCGRAPVKQ